MKKKLRAAISVCSVQTAQYSHPNEIIVQPSHVYIDPSAHTHQIREISGGNRDGIIWKVGVHRISKGTTCSEEGRDGKQEGGMCRERTPRTQQVNRTRLAFRQPSLKRFLHTGMLYVSKPTSIRQRPSASCAQISPPS